MTVGRDVEEPDIERVDVLRHRNGSSAGIIHVHCDSSVTAIRGQAAAAASLDGHAEAVSHDWASAEVLRVRCTIPPSGLDRFFLRGTTEAPAKIQVTAEALSAIEQGRKTWEAGHIPFAGRVQAGHFVAFQLGNRMQYPRVICHVTNVGFFSNVNDMFKSCGPAQCAPWRDDVETMIDARNLSGGKPAKASSMIKAVQFTYVRTDAGPTHGVPE